jgi:hypothetical protein
MTEIPIEPPEGDGEAALAAAQEPVEISVRLIDDERTPDDMVCMGTFRGERLMARCVLSPEAWEHVREHDLFAEPVPLILVAREAPPGVQCQLYALIQLPEGMGDEGDDEAEPWATSVPGSSYEDAVKDLNSAEDDPASHVAAFPLGNIVRFEKDRVHQEDLALEAADVLRKLLEGRTTEVVDRALDDLLGGL